MATCVSKSFLAPIAAMVLCGFSMSSLATTCYDKNGQELPINNDQVIQWEATAANGFLSRGHISGTVEAIFKDETNHAHFSVKIGPDADNHVEVIYELSYGALSNLEMGSNVEACGDFIQSNAPYHGYSASPDGAILHWVHASDSASHEPGFVEVDGTVYGGN